MPKLRRSVEKLRAKYESEGFLTADVSAAHVPAGAGLVNVTFDVVEGRKLHVRNVNFVGNVSFTDAELAEKIETRAADTLSFLNGTGKLSAESLARDVLALTVAYYDVGYVAAKIAPPLVTLSADRAEIDVTFSIDEGRRYRVGDVGFVGEAHVGMGGLTREELYAETSLRPGEWFSRKKMAADMERLTRRLRDEGYAYASVTPVSALERSTDTEVCTVEAKEAAR